MGFRRLFGSRVKAGTTEGDAAVDGAVKKAAVLQIPPPDRPLSGRVLELECRIRTLLVEPHLYDRFFVPVAKEFYSIAWGFPASDGNHHPGRLGLIEHSLGVVVRMLRDAPLFADGLTGSKKDSFLWHCVLAGLGHDLGKTLEWLVDSRGYDYSPLSGCVRDQGFTPISHSNTGKHASLSTVVFSRLLNACPAYLHGRVYSARDLSSVLEAILDHHNSGPSVKNPYLSLLVKADREDCEEDLMVVPTEAELSAREENIIREREAARAKQVEVAIRAIKLVLPEARYGDGWYITENDWLLIVSPRWTDREGYGVLHEYQKLLGRDVRPYDLWTLLREAGVLIPLGEDKDFQFLKITKNGKLGERSLCVAAFALSHVLTEEEVDDYDRYSIKGLNAILQKTLFKADGAINEQQS